MRRQKSTTYLQSGRVKQKQETRGRIVDETVRLIAAGQSPTVTEAADSAGVSRRTAYRYFTSQEQLLAEAAIRAAQGARPDLPDTDDVKSRVESMVRANQRFVYTNETALRLVAQVFFREPLKGRPAKELPSRRERVKMIETALAPARAKLSHDTFENLVSGLVLCMGIEAATVLLHLRGLSAEKSVTACAWAAKALVVQALAQQNPKKSSF